MAVSVKLDLDIDRRLRVLARRKSCSHHYMMCEAIRRFVEQEEARLDEGNEPTATVAEDMNRPARATSARPFAEGQPI